MTNPMDTEVRRLALNLIRTDDSGKNSRSFLAGLRTFEDPMDRLGLSFNTMCYLASQIRESSKHAGTYDLLIANVEQALLDLVIDDH